MARGAAQGAHDETPDGVEQRIDWLQGAIEGLCVPGPSEINLGCCACWRRRWIAASRPSWRWPRTRCSRAEPRKASTASRPRSGPSGARLESLRRGLELIPAAAPYLGLIAASRHATENARAAFLEACAFRGLPIEPHVGELVTSTNVELQRAAAGLLRYAPRTVADEHLTCAFGCADPRAERSRSRVGSSSDSPKPGASGARSRSRT